MTALTWQTLLLLTAAYFAGCCLGCILRRMLWPPRVTVPEAVAHPAVAAASQGAVTGAALSRSGETRPLPATQEPVRRAQPIEAVVPAERETVAVTAPARKEEPQAERVVEARPVERRPAPIATPVPRVEEKITVAAPDDLKRIHLIDTAIESKLNALGVRRYAEIAQWTAADVARISKELGFKGRIQHENWIEQAQVLAKGGETHYARRLARGEPVATIRETAQVSESKPDVPDRAAFSLERAPAKEDRPAPVVPRDSVGVEPKPVGMTRDNLQRILGINAEIEALVARQGVTRYTQIAGWTKVDVDRFDQLLGQNGRIARENWIEQAQILAKGGDTTYSREVDRAAADEPGGAGDAEASKSARTTDLSGLRSVRSEALRGDAHDGPREIGSAGRIAVPSDLKRIRGVGVSIEKRLHAMGVTSYEHIANWTASDIDRISQSLDFKGRIERENWVEQARILAAGGQTEFSRRFDRSGGHV
jgi:predicted flap endonuclease-1-like 5' DNA nuclease